jgi:hypothetical protein
MEVLASIKPQLSELDYDTLKWVMFESATWSPETGHARGWLPIATEPGEQVPALQTIDDPERLTEPGEKIPSLRPVENPQGPTKPRRWLRVVFNLVCLGVASVMVAFMVQDMRTDAETRYFYAIAFVLAVGATVLTELRSTRAYISRHARLIKGVGWSLVALGGAGLIVSVLVPSDLTAERAATGSITVVALGLFTTWLPGMRKMLQ